MRPRADSGAGQEGLKIKPKAKPAGGMRKVNGMFVFDTPAPKPTEAPAEQPAPAPAPPVAAVPTPRPPPPDTSGDGGLYGDDGLYGEPSSTPAPAPQGPASSCSHVLERGAIIYYANYKLRIIEL